MNEQNLAVTVAVDIGYGHCKIAFNDPRRTLQTMSFPSATLATEMFPRNKFFSPEPVLLTTGVGNTFLTGDDIFNLQTSVQTPNHSEEFCLTEIYRDLLTAALHRQPFDSIDQLSLALPLLTYGDYRVRLAQIMTKDFYVGPNRTVKVKNVTVHAQGAAAARATVNPKLYPKIMAADLGSHTLDLISIVQGNFQHEECHSIPAGLRDLVNEITTSLYKSGDMKYSQANRQIITKILVTNKLAYVGDNVVGASDLLSRAPSYMAELRRLLTKFVSQNSQIVALGGGANVIANAMGMDNQRVVMPENPFFANALGMLD